MNVSQEQTDRDQLRMLSIFHFVVAGFSLLGLGFIFVHRLIFKSVFNNPEFTQGAGGGPPPEMFAILDAFYWVAGCLIATHVILTALSGWFLWHRRHRVFSIVVAVVNCFNFPLGTILGIFTLVVLMRESVQIAYGDQ